MARESEREREKNELRREMLSISSWHKLSYEDLGKYLEKCYSKSEIDTVKFRLLMREV